MLYSRSKKTTIAAKNLLYHLLYQIAVKRSKDKNGRNALLLIKP